MLSNAAILAADSGLTDDIIIARVLSGKKEEYEIIVRRYNQLLYKSARGILSNEGDIEDAMQEAYVRAYEHLRQFRGEARFSTWLTRILINCALQQAGRLKREHLSFEPLDDDDEYLDESQPASGEVSENLRKAIESAISQLPSKYRLIFILREVEHKSVAETATVTGISEENVKIRHHRAKSMLRDMLKGRLETLDVFELHAARCHSIAERVMARIASIRIASLYESGTPPGIK